MRAILTAAVIVACMTCPAWALDRPWISTVYFYWYTWDYDTELGGWMGGIYNTPLRGYYHSPSYDDNLASIHEASEWGVTHHFMDYWGHGWLDDEGNPREDVLMRATEDLQQRGYDVFMSIYQDGTDFDMAEFSKNLDPGRDAEFYINRFADSPAYPRVDGKPVFLIYGRNGVPQITATTESFQAWLRDRHGTIAAVNERWGASFQDFDEIRLDMGARGHQRAESIKHQYALWEDEIARTNALSQERFGLPGVKFSWDIGYAPFRGFTFSDQARVFCGPHSYGGIFGVPHQLDVERFIQAAVAKRYGTVFFDTFKNFYHDWNIRIPGAAYPADFCAFDRFWVQSLSHYSRALLHLSWNEWWEGSNLEPDFEYGKTYCEKNLLYASIMQQCFDSIRNWNEGAQTAVLLNDWHWLAGGTQPDDIYACIQALRRNNIRFDLLPDDFVTAEELARFDVVLAPSGGTGFGYNADDERILDLLMEWAAGDEGRRLLIDDTPGLATTLALPLRERVEDIPEPGADMSIFVDVGEEGDDEFLVEGASHREDWGRLPPDAFGATTERHTVRWTPASGSATRFRLPFSPHRDHVLRLTGSAIWGNRVEVQVEDRPAAEFDIRPGDHGYEVAIPAEAVGGLAFGELALIYEQAHVPTERDPERYPTEMRVCNFALGGLQLATANIPFTTEQNYTLPEAGVRFTDAAPPGLAGRTLTGPYYRYQRLAPTDRALSLHAADDTPRDVVAGEAQNILYVNGLFSGVEDPAYLDALLREWAGRPRELDIEAPDIIATPLVAGDTDIILAYNYAAPERRSLSMALPSPADRPIVEINVLSRDGEVQQQPDRVDVADESRALRDEFDYYAVYQVTRGNVALTTPELALAPGQTLTVNLELEHRAGPQAQGVVRLVSHLPSLTSNEAAFTVAPGGRATVPLQITARQDVDWGLKTVIFDVEIEGRHAYFWRTLLVNRLPDLQVTTRVIDAATRQARVEAVPFPWAEDAPATDVRLRALDAEVAVGDVAPGAPVEITLPAAPDAGEQPALVTTPATLQYAVGGVAHEREASLGFATYPLSYPRAQDAVAPMIVANPHDEYLENMLVSLQVSPDLLGGRPAYVRERGGNVVPSQMVEDRLYWIAMLPPHSANLFYLCAGEAPQPPTDLVIEQDGARVTVGNSKFTLGWDGSRGGTVISFVSRATGKDYGAGSFGVGHGTWGEFNPLSPRTNTVRFVEQEEKVWQRDSEARPTVRVGLRGPVIASVDVEVTLEDGVQARQRYMIPAYSSDFTVGSEITVPQSDELVALDIRLDRNDLTKTFPNFVGTGEGFAEDNPTAGWREAPYIPPYATMMTPHQYRESISVIPWDEARMEGINRFRQGFWPEDRPQAGPVNYAQMELVATDATSASAGARIVLHPGHQKFARIHRETRVGNSPAVILPGEWEWEGELAAAPAPPADWWNPYWHFAAPVTVRLPEGHEPNPWVNLALDFEALLDGRGRFDPASPRAVVHSAEGFAELPVVFDQATGELVVTLTDAAWPGDPPTTREFMLYFDTLEMGPKRTVWRPDAPLSDRLLNASFEDGERYWTLHAGARLHPEARTGAHAAELEWREGWSPVVISNNTLRVHPNSRYRVSFWARTESPQAAVRTNFYDGREHDFPQLAIPIEADGRWRRYTVELSVGAFPQHVNPALRFWVLGEEQTVWLDDVEVEPVEPRPAPPQPQVSVGAVITP